MEEGLDNRLQNAYQFSRYSYFVKQQDLKDSHCLLLARHTSENRNKLNCELYANDNYTSERKKFLAV